ncbi:MAG: hypothetical protein HY056_13930 [Proteobacteria bacterium]|nr:hypothetical protein [Pseudomonadota bacterium]
MSYTRILATNFRRGRWCATGQCIAVQCQRVRTQKPISRLAECPPDHDDFRSNRAKIMNVIDSSSLEHDVIQKSPRTFRHDALEISTIARFACAKRKAAT